MSETIRQMLIIGSGGREDALAKKMRSEVREIHNTPSNTGIALRGGKTVDIDPLDVDRLEAYAHDHDIDLTVVGPEAPLAQGIVNVFQESGLSIFGPTQEAARLETSKVWQAEFLERHPSIPHPDGKVFSDPQSAIKFLKHAPWEPVIKADGIAAGKGVYVPNSIIEAEKAVLDLMQKRVAGQAGEKIVIQERLYGKELSMMALTDGTTVVPLLPARDYKRLLTGDGGPNTGGMGAYAPVKVDSEDLKCIYNDILQATVDAMRAEDNPFQGLLYAGLMLTKDGPKVLEFNARFGDPETQALLTLWKSELSPALLATTNETLSPDMVEFRDGSAVCVVLAAEGYPGKHKRGDRIRNLRRNIQDPNLTVYHAGTRSEGGNVYTDKGRVLGVTAYGKNLYQARQNAYSGFTEPGPSFPGMQFRRDIARDEITEELYSSS